MQVVKVSFPYWRTDMRYCPHCRRFNEGKPTICNFCGRTWYVRLCPRGHENPYNAQYCGTCGSSDLTETAGPRSWFFIAMKIVFWVFIGLLVYLIIATFFNLLRPPAVYQALNAAVIICLSSLVFQLALSMLPQSIGDGVRRIIRWGMKLVGKAIGWLLMKIWEVLK